MTDLYGAVTGYLGRPTASQLLRVPALAQELGQREADLQKLAGGLAALNRELGTRVEPLVLLTREEWDKKRSASGSAILPVPIASSRIRGRGQLLRSSLPVRWFFVGMVFYFITCLQCAFQVTLTNASSQAVGIQYSTANGTADGLPRVQPRITASRPNVATNSLPIWAGPDRACRDREKTGSSNIPCAAATPARRSATGLRSRRGASP